SESGQVLVMPNGEDGKSEPLVPEAFGNRDQLKTVPEVGASFSQRLRVLSDALVQMLDDLDGHVEADTPANAFVEHGRVKQGLQAGHMVEMGMGDEDRVRQPAAVAPGVTLERIRSAVDE